MKTYLIHCGNYRHFEVDADNEQDALAKFEKEQPAGFAVKDVTDVELALDERRSI